MSRLRLVRSVGCLALSLLVACGVPTQDSAERLGDQGAVALVDPPPASRPGAVSISVFLVRGVDLVAVARAVEPVTVDGAVHALIAGPSKEEAAAGLHSAVGPSTRVRQAVAEDRVARIDLSSPFAQARSEDQVVAVAQFVYTVTGLADIEAVSITVDGEPIEVPTPDGGLRSGPLRRADFPGLKAVPS
ncbi:MAG TPA: GerMN domain-containing protein [Acidimicrobiales bacterium]|nr:GerMN domain-containing protein [Acidimicrobiales bacterium]